MKHKLFREQQLNCDIDTAWKFSQQQIIFLKLPLKIWGLLF